MKKTITTTLLIIIIHISVNAQLKTFVRYENYLYEPNSKIFLFQDCGEELNKVQILKDKIILNENTYTITGIEIRQVYDSTQNKTIEEKWFKCKTKNGGLYVFSAVIDKQNIEYFTYTIATAFLTDMRIKKFTNSKP
jgi:hypothetical protein